MSAALKRHKQKVEAATNAIDAVFGDMSVAKAQNLDSLCDLQSDIDAKIDALRDDIERGTGERP